MSLKYYRYRIPFVRPFETSSGRFTVREGIILQLRRNGITAFGEAAPLPGFSKESPNQVLAQLQKHAEKIGLIFQEERPRNSLLEFYSNHQLVPSLSFALETLACSYEAAAGTLPVNRLLFANPDASLPVNAVVPLSSLTETIQAVIDRVQEGYQTLKLKVGNNFRDDLEVLTEIRNQFPNISLRIDANQAWDTEKAIANLRQLEGLNIEYCEEPLTRPNLSSLRKLVEHSSVPIALDETLSDLDVIRKVAPIVPVLVLKPMILGPLSNLFATKHLADTHDNKVIYTTVLESGIGRLMTANLASGLGSKESAHGLATGQFLTVDVWHDRTYINNGNFSLPDNSGQNEKYGSDIQNIAEEIHLKRD